MFDLLFFLYFGSAFGNITDIKKSKLGLKFAGEKQTLKSRKTFEISINFFNSVAFGFSNI